jgi:NAD-dependent deacetylase
VVWFGEQLPEDALRSAGRALRECDLFFSVGTSAVVHPAAGFARLARSHGAAVIEINPEPTPVSGLVTWSLRGKSGEILPELVDLAIAG